MPTRREERLQTDFAALKALAAASSVFELEATGDIPERYTLLFRGKGVSREASPQAAVEFVELHKVDIRLPYSYPERPPDIRWLTPILHPNISFSGFIDLAEVGLPWSPALGLDVVCERLWDLARLAYVNLEKPANYAAKQWYEKNCQLALPIDARPLRDKAGTATSKNIIRYQRRGQTRDLAVAGAASEVLFIGEDTPTPRMPIGEYVPRVARPPRHARRDGEDDVLYIGDE